MQLICYLPVPNVCCIIRRWVAKNCSSTHFNYKENFWNCMKKEKYPGRREKKASLGSAHFMITLNFINEKSLSLSYEKSSETRD
ncbi:hypothetical protein XENTR_v10009348 [Xenopus tropicalis]|nr:hypothetical protein XENTR_v10009348 [Xenopus tropicalis]